MAEYARRHWINLGTSVFETLVGGTTAVGKVVPEGATRAVMPKKIEARKARDAQERTIDDGDEG